MPVLDRWMVKPIVFRSSVKPAFGVMVTWKNLLPFKLPEKPAKLSEASTPPSAFEVNEKRDAALGFADKPTEENEPNVTPVAVGGGVGSVVPELAVTDAKSYV